MIHYVAGLVEDMQMPPPGKGDRLTAQQVGILRAWIDQGAKWGTPETFPQSAATFSPVLRWFTVEGDEKKFRELEGIKQNAGGGVEYFSLEQRDSPDKKVVVQGHFLAPEKDLALTLTLTRRDVGFVRAGFEQWRRYYDDTGGLFQSTPPLSFDLDRDLHLDVGRAWVDFGLTLPNLPQVVLGYEYDFRKGTKSTLEWGPVVQGATVENVYPADKVIDERVHVIKLDVSHELRGWRLEDNARVEFYQNNTLDRQALGYTTGPLPDLSIRTRQDFSHVQGANTFRLEKQITDWWFGSGGYLYSRFDGDSSLNQSTVDSLSSPTFGNYWRDQVTLRRDSHIFSVASVFLPFDGLSLSLGAQNEFTRQEGFGDIHLDASIPPIPGVITPLPATVQSDLDETKTTESALLRYTKIPFTVLFADGRFAQDSIGQFESDSPGSPDAFTLKTDYGNRLEDVRAGFSTSPWRWVALNAHYRYRDSDSDYNHLVDTNPGYPGFIRHRKILTDEVETKLVLQPVSWLKTAFTYQWTRSDYFTTTDSLLGIPFYGDVSPGGQVFASRDNAHVYGFNATFIPSQRFYFNGAFTYSDSRVTTWAQQSGGPVVPYSGGIYSVIASANYALNSKTALKASYTFSRAGYGQRNPGGLPLGLDYTQHGVAIGITRQLSARVSSTLRYHFYQYTEPSTGGFNDFTAQPVSDPASMKLPAMLVSISNFPATARPQAGLSFASYVFEFSITEGATRFLTVFYGDYPKPEVPVTGNCPVRMEPFEQTSDAIVGNRVWLDWNGDGVQQFEEPGVGGVCVNLYDASGAQVDATTTDSNGYYGFNLPAADDRYVIEVVQPPGMLFTTFKAGGNDDLDSDVDPPSGRMEVTARGTLLTLDAGLVVVPGAEPTPNPDQPPPKPEVGPVRSGRLLYADLAAMFQDSCLVYAFASPEVLSQIPYCSMVSHEIQGGGYMLPLERMWAIAKDNRKDDTVFDYSSNLYTQAPPPGGEPAKRLDVYFAYLNQSGWRYDPLMQSYLRYTDTTVQSEAGQLHPDTDRLTRRQLHFENIIILTADHVVVTPTNLDIDLEQGGKGPAYLFRDGQIYAIRWSTKSGGSSP